MGKPQRRTVAVQIDRQHQPEKRKLQAEVAKSIFEEMKIELGEDKAKKILKNAIIKNAIDEGKKFRKIIDGQTKNNESVIKKFTDVFELWKTGGALEIEEIKKNDDEYHFNVTRCKYAEMYNDMGLKDIGQLLSCNRDYNFSVGFDKNLILERKKTIMEGHSCCTFRYSNKEKI